MHILCLQCGPYSIYSEVFIYAAQQNITVKALKNTTKFVTYPNNLIVLIVEHLKMKSMELLLVNTKPLLSDFIIWEIGNLGYIQTSIETIVT